ncbi:MAG TPA: hypothetical protein PLH79_16185 [bacterium]|nr:hypothetical protein [bacterium]
MKYHVFCGFVLGCLFFVAPASQAQLIFSADFSAAQGYTDGQLVGQPAGAATVWMEGMDAVDNPAFMVVHEQFVITQEVDATGASIYRWILYPLPVQTGKFTTAFEWQYVGPTDGSIDVGFCLSSTENFDRNGNGLPDFNEQGVMCRFQQGGRVIDACNGQWDGSSHYERSQDILYADGTKFFMRYEIDADPQVQTFDVFVRPEGQSEILLADTFGFRQDCPNGLDVIAIWVDGNFPNSQVIIDNIVVAGPAPVADWPMYE